MRSFCVGTLVFLSMSSIVFAKPVELKSENFKNFPNSLQGEHFFTLKSSSKEASTKISKQISTSGPWQSPIDLQSCRDQISQVICLVEPANKNSDPRQRPCLKGGENYSIFFEQLFDNYPPVLQKMFCSLKHIYIEKQFFGTAYAGTTHDANGNINGAILGIRQSVLDENLNLTTWASWKEQLSFGGVSGSYTPVPDLPLIETTTNAQVSDFLYFVVAHEFGHMLDFANNLNAFQKNCRSEEDGYKTDCDLVPGSWGSLSWLTDKTPRPEFDFVNRLGFCFYMCKPNEFIHKDQTAQVYLDLYNSNFISAYGSQQPWDDWADSVAYYMMSLKLNTSYVIHPGVGPSYDIINKLHSPVFSEKYKYIESVFNRLDLKYP